jgi:hypothetical protein
MQGLVVGVGANGVGNVVTIALRFANLAKVFLFVEYVVLGACNDTCTLDALDRRCDQSTSQIWIRAKPFL